MIQVKNTNYFISEKLIAKVFKRNDRYFARTKGGETQEIDEKDYLNLGGKI